MTTKEQILYVIIVLLVPAMVAVIKDNYRRIPKKWTPVAAITCGVVAHFLIILSGDNSISNPLVGATAGLAGIGLRELYDKLAKGGGDDEESSGPILPRDL